MQTRNQKIIFCLIAFFSITQCKTTDRNQLHSDDTSDTIGEFTRRKLEFMAPYSYDTHYPPPRQEGNKCVKDAYAHLFADTDYVNQLGPALGWWKESEKDVVSTERDIWNAKLYVLIVDLEIRCTVDTGSRVLPGCAAGDTWAPYRQLSYSINTYNEPLLARNLMILLKKNYFVSPKDDPTKSCDNNPIDSGSLETCVRSQVPEYQYAAKCKDQPSYSLVYNNPKYENVDFSAFIANGTWRAFEFSKIDLFPFVGSQPGMDPYVMRVPLERQEKAYAMDLVVLSEANKGLVTKFVLFNPAYNKSAITNSPTVLGKYQSQDGLKMIAEIERHIDIGNKMRVKSTRLIPRGLKPLTRGNGDEPTEYH